MGLPTGAAGDMRAKLATSPVVYLWLQAILRALAYRPPHSYTAGFFAIGVRYEYQ
jgi:hypothetical protein